MNLVTFLVYFMSSTMMDVTLMLTTVTTPFSMTGQCMKVERQTHEEYLVSLDTATQALTQWTIGISHLL